MSFYGKTFRRTHHENIDKLLATSSKLYERFLENLKNCSAPTIRFTKVENGLHVDLRSGPKQFSEIFKLGEEKEIVRIDGKKIKMTYTQEGENILNQVIVMPDGKSLFLKREFEGGKGKMTVTIEGRDLSAYVYFEQIE